MTKLQALFVLYFRHENFEGCSWRELATRYYERYGNILGKTPRLIGSQLDGRLLDDTASDILKGDNVLFGDIFDLYDCDLTSINANLKRHIKICK